MSIKISRILHAGYVLECEGTQIAFDPIFENPFSRNCYAFPSVKFDLESIRKLKFAAVFISHSHDDHCSLESLELLDRQTPIYLYCLEQELFGWIRELGFTQVHALRIDVPVHVGEFAVTPRRALDFEMDSMFQIRAQGLNILNVVDSWIDPTTLQSLFQQRPWDLVMWPFQPLRELEVLAPSRAKPWSEEIPGEWLEQLQILNPKYVIASSCQFRHEIWSWYNHALFPVSYQKFKQEVEACAITSTVLRLNPSTAIVLDHGSIEPSSPLNWVEPLGEQDVDYQYEKNLIPPSTSEIARNLAPLSREQSELVDKYCKEGLIEKFQTLQPSIEALTEAYFDQPRIWQLSVFDHRGEVKNYFYQINKNHLESVPGALRPIAWMTEVTASKLFAALTSGESLTSMYMRINAAVFAPNIETELESVDIVEDPLIRCLFTGTFGSYQLAQLKKIKESRT